MPTSQMNPASLTTAILSRGFLSAASSILEWPQTGPRATQVIAHAAQAAAFIEWMRDDGIRDHEKALLADLAVARMASEASELANFLARVAQAGQIAGAEGRPSTQKDIPSSIRGQIARALVEAIPAFIQTEYTMTRYPHSVATALDALSALLDAPDLPAVAVCRIARAMMNDDHQHEFLGEHWPILARALRHPAAPLELLTEAATHPSRAIRTLALEHPECPTDARIMAALLGTSGPDSRGGQS